VATGQGGLEVGVVQDNIAIFLKALEGVTNTTVLSNPKVLTLDKQPGYIHIGKTIYYNGSNTTTTTTNTVSVSSVDTGVTLTFRPYIGDDGYIRLEIDPNDSTPTATSSSTATGVPPDINNNEVSSNILVKDGRTVVIGGLFSDTSSTTKNQVPFFGNLPLAGPLFGQQSDSTTRNEIIFLLTPHIVKDEDQYSKYSEEELKDTERLRVGVRKNMLPWGRERLADTCFECAEAELHKPNPDLNMVRWHLDCATNLNPLFIEAIKLKEKVSGEELEAADNSSIRSFLRREMLAENLHVGLIPAELPPKVLQISAPPRQEAPIPVPPQDRPATQPVGEGPQGPAYQDVADLSPKQRN
jgi:type IV pilus assembly protein PilQ